MICTLDKEVKLPIVPDRVVYIFFNICTVDKEMFLAFCTFLYLQDPVHRSRVFYFNYIIWQDVGIRTRVAGTAAWYATNELHTSLN